jgi:hypothetical protein
MEGLLYWGLTLLLIAFIFIMDVWGRSVVNFLKANTPFQLLILTVFLGFLFYLFYFLRVTLTLRKRITYGTLFVALLIFSYIALLDVRAPEETLHYVEFGILGYLICRAVFVTFPRQRAWYWIVIFLSLISWLAEYVQLYIPTRIFEPKDMEMNFLGSAFGLLFTLIVLRERNFLARPKR